MLNADDIRPDLHVTLPPNMQGRDYLLGDLHGEFDALEEELKKVKFNPKTDRVISVGDLIDRGPNSHACLALVDQPWFFATRGNHEAMLLDAEFEGKVAMWVANGGEWYLELTEAQKEQCVKWALSMPLAITLNLANGGRIGICHAEWPGEDWAFVGEAVRDLFAAQAMLWGRRVISKEAHQQDQSAVLTVHGHTPIDAPKRLGSALFIDTGCVYGGTLTLVSVEQALQIPSEAPKKRSMITRLREFRNRR